MVDAWSFPVQTFEEVMEAWTVMTFSSLSQIRFESYLTTIIEDSMCYLYETRNPFEQALFTNRQ